LEDIGLTKRMILKWILQKWHQKESGLDLSGSQQTQVKGFRAKGSESSGSLNTETVLTICFCTVHCNTVV